MLFRSDHSYVMEDRDAARHAFRVASGLARPLYVTAPAGTYTLLVGFPDALAPSYELQHARDVVLSTASGAATTGPLEPNPAFARGARLAQDGQAPKMFARLSKRAVPAKGLTFSCMCLLGGVVMLYVNPSVIGAFTMITTVSAILFMFVWTIILCSYLVYRKQRPHLHEKSIYKMPLGKLMCWVCMALEGSWPWLRPGRVSPCWAAAEGPCWRCWPCL